MLHTKPKFLTLAVFVFFSFPLALSAQDYRRGYIIKENGDSVNGFIVYRAGKKNSAYCVFKVTRKSKPVKYTANDLSAYGFLGDKQYLSMSLPNRSTEGKVFGQVLVNGAISLYRFNKLFLVKKDSLILLESPKNKQIETSIGLRTRQDRRYNGMLNYLLSECEITADLTSYTERDLTNLINNYNRCKGQEPTYKKPRPIAKVNYYLFTGYLQSNMKMKVVKDATFNPSNTLVGGLGFDISSPRIFDKLFISLEAWYVKSFYQAYTEGPFVGGTQRDDILIDVSYFKMPVGLRYNFLQENNTPYIKAGFSLCFRNNITIKTRTEQEASSGNVFTYESYGGYNITNPKGIWASVGYDKTIFRNLKMFAEFRYENSEGFIGTGIQSFSTVKNYNFLLGFRF